MPKKLLWSVALMRVTLFHVLTDILVTQMAIIITWLRWRVHHPVICPCWRCTSAAPVTQGCGPPWAGPFPLASWWTHHRSAWMSSATSPMVRNCVSLHNELCDMTGWPQYLGKHRALFYNAVDSCFLNVGYAYAMICVKNSTFILGCYACGYDM